MTPNAVPLEAQLHAKGPLVYGVCTTLPAELTVLGADGSTVHGESLHAAASEVARFCEAYAEP